MRVGTLMPGNRGCRSHASRWGPMVLPDPGIRARLYLSFSFSRLPRFPASFAPSSVFIYSSLMFPPFSTFFSPLLFPLFLFLSRLSRTSVITYMEGGGMVYPSNATQTSLHGASSWAHEKNILHAWLWRRNNSPLEIRCRNGVRNNALVRSIPNDLFLARALFNNMTRSNLCEINQIMNIVIGFNLNHLYNIDYNL